jgi:hypothetical protein
VRPILFFTLFLSACSFNADISATKSDFAGEAKAEESAITWTWINQLDVALEYTSLTLQVYSGDSCAGSAIYTENITSMDGSKVYTPSAYGDYSFNILTQLKDGGTDVSPCLADATYESGTPIFTVDTDQTTHLFTALDDFSRTFTGTCSPNGATITSSVGVASSTVCSGGEWSMSLSLYSEAAGAYTSVFTATNNSLTYTRDLALIKTSATLGGSIAAPGVYTNTLSPTFTLLSPTATEMKLSNSSDCSGTWETLSVSKVWTIANSDALNTVYAMFRDSVGAYSACSSDTITHDGTAPTAPGSLADGTSSTSLTDSPTITWTAATDAGSGLDHYEIAIGTSAGGTQTLAYTDIGTVLTYQNTSLTLTSGTTYYVSLRAVDVAGNTTTVTSDGWLADNVAPTAPSGFTLIDPTRTPSATDSTPTVRVSGVVSGDTITVYTDSACATSIGSATASATTVDITTSALAKGQYNFYAKSVDLAGNASACSTAEFIYNYVELTDWAQTAYIKPVNNRFTVSGVLGMRFGSSVDIEGDTMVIGALTDSSAQTTITNGSTAASDNGADSSGSAFVYTRTNGNWSQQAYLKASNTSSLWIWCGN